MQTHTRRHECTHKHAHVHRYIQVSTHHTYKCAHVSTRPKCTRVCTRPEHAPRTQTHVCMPVHTHLHSREDHTHLCTGTQMSIHQVCKYAHIHRHRPDHTYVCTLTYPHTGEQTHKSIRHHTETHTRRCAQVCPCPHAHTSAHAQQEGVSCPLRQDSRITFSPVSLRASSNVEQIPGSS